MADQEKLHIKLGLSGTYWDKKPQYRISFNNQVLEEGTISLPSDEISYHEFDVEYTEETGSLKIELLNKASSDTLKSNDVSEDYTIVADMLLNVVSVEIDEIDLGMLPYFNGVYSTLEPVNYNGESTQAIKECMNMGWNGAWTLTWTNPFYLWLLEVM